MIFNLKKVTIMNQVDFTIEQLKDIHFNILLSVEGNEIKMVNDLFRYIYNLRFECEQNK